MAGNPLALRIYLQYEKLYAAEYRGLLRDLERAYNKIDAFLYNRERVPASRKLLISQISTGKSIETLLSGVSTTLVGLGAVLYIVERAGTAVEKVATVREAVWHSEETKWHAKTARLEYEDKVLSRLQEGLTKEDERLLYAQEALNRRLLRIRRRKEIKDISIEIVEEEDETTANNN